MSAEYLITGGAGFIGSNIAERLVRDGRTVRVLDSFLTGNRHNLATLTGKVELIEGDVRDSDVVRRAVTGVRYVLHVAALPSVPRSIADPVLSNDINVQGTLQLLAAARDAGCQRFVFSSSSSVYGDTPVMPKHEAMSPCPLSPYAVQKLTGEHYARLFWDLYGLESVSLRYFNVFGPRQDPASEYAAVIPRFITAIMGGCAPTIYGDGSQSRDFTHVRNVVDANLASCTASRDACGHVFNVACGERIALNDLVAMINGNLGKNIVPSYAPRRVGDIQHSQADITLAGKLLGWTPRTTFADGLAQTIEWYSRQPPR
jgi:nucleoside-diphosphate-sugar epimerase